MNYCEADAQAALDKSLALARTICSNGPLGIRAVKQLIAVQADVSLEAAMAESLKRRLPLNDTADFKAGVAAFKHRGKPEFTGY